MKTLTDFRKTVETGVDPRLHLRQLEGMFICYMKGVPFLLKMVYKG